MVVEITSRVLAVIAALAFTLVFTTGRLPVIPKGRWTVIALFALGLAMCTAVGTRDGLGTSLAQPTRSRRSSPPWASRPRGCCSPSWSA